MRTTSLMIRLPQVVIALIFLLVGRPAVAQEAAAQEGKARQFALLVACSDYPHLRSYYVHQYGEVDGLRMYERSIALPGARNDIRLMAGLVKNELGVDAVRTYRLEGEPGKDPADRVPTKANIFAHLDRLARAVKPGDRVIIHMSGHGSQQLDTSGDEPDGKDEVFLPADALVPRPLTGAYVNSITDDELGVKLRAIRKTGATVWLIMDHCHSGTMVRAMRRAGRTRRIDPEIIGLRARGGARGTRAPRETAEKLARGSGGEIIAMYGAQSHCEAPELDLPLNHPSSRPHGLLTFLLVREIQRAGTGQTFEELFSRIVSAYQSHWTGTVPQAAGALDLVVGGGAAKRSGLLLLDVVGGQWSLRAGALSAIEEGMVLEVYEPGRGGASEAVVGRVRVQKTDFTRSTCRPLKGDADRLRKRAADHRAWPARVVEAPRPRHTLRIAAIGPDGAAIRFDDLGEEVQKALTADGAQQSFPFVEDPGRADWLLWIDSGDVHLRSARCGAGDARTFVVKKGRLQGQLRTILRAENLKRLVGDRRLGRLPPGLTVEMWRVDPRGEEPGGKKLARVQNAGVLHPGDWVSLFVRNGSGKILDVWAFYIDADSGVSVLFPEDGDPRLAAADRGEKCIGPMIMGSETGIEHLLVVAAPRGASDPRLNLSVLAQDPLAHAGSRQRGASGGWLAELLEDAAFGTRTRGRPVAVGRPVAEGLAMVTFRTTWGAVGPPPSFPNPTYRVLRPDNLRFADPPICRESEELVAAPSPEGALKALHATVAGAVALVEGNGTCGTACVAGPAGKLLTTAALALRAGRYRVDGKLLVRLRFPADSDSIDAEVDALDARLGLARLVIRPPDRAENRRAPLRLIEASPSTPGHGLVVGHAGRSALWTVRRAALSTTNGSDALVAGVDLPAADRARLGALNGASFLAVAGTAPGAEEGAPVVDGKGRLLGLVRWVRANGASLAVPAADLRGFLSADRAKGVVAPPCAWNLGPNLALSRTETCRAGWDVLLAGHDRPEQVLIDLDGSWAGDLAAAGAFGQIVDRREFDPEIGLHFEPGRRVAFYDTNNDGGFDLARVDQTGDGITDVVFRRLEGVWRAVQPRGERWLGTGPLSYLTSKDLGGVMEKLRYVRAISGTDKPRHGGVK